MPSDQCQVSLVSTLPGAGQLWGAHLWLAHSAAALFNTEAKRMCLRAGQPRGPGRKLAGPGRHVTLRGGLCGAQAGQQPPEDGRAEAGAQPEHAGGGQVPRARGRQRHPQVRAGAQALCIGIQLAGGVGVLHSRPLLSGSSCMQARMACHRLWLSTALARVLWGLWGLLRAMAFVSS